METIFILVTYFLIYSFLGWCVESIYKSCYQKKFVNSGFLYGPFCPIYGFGAIIMYTFLDDVQNRPIIIFCLGFVILTIWEYIAGFILEKVFHTKYWDYSEYKYNLHGRVCLRNSIFWGILSVVFINIINPVVNIILDKIDDTYILYFDIFVGIIFAVDFILSVISALSIPDKLKNIDELNISIKEKIDEIKTKAKETDISESLQEALEDLKLKRDKLVKKMSSNILRIKNAFPTMKSEPISKFLKSREKKEDTNDTRDIYNR